MGQMRTPDARGPVPGRGTSAVRIVLIGATIVVGAAAVLSSLRSGATDKPQAAPTVIDEGNSVPPIEELAPTSTLAGGIEVAAESASATIEDPASPLAGGAADTVAPPDAGLATPTAAVRNLWDSWRDNDSPRGTMYADSAVTRRLFGTPWAPEFAIGGCAANEAGYSCTFEAPKLRWSMQVRGDDERGYRVVSLAIVDVKRQPGEPLVNPESTIVDPAADRGFAPNTPVQPVRTDPETGLPVDTVPGGEVVGEGDSPDVTADINVDTVPPEVATTVRKRKKKVTATTVAKTSTKRKKVVAAGSSADSGSDSGSATDSGSGSGSADSSGAEPGSGGASESSDQAPPLPPVAAGDNPVVEGGSP
jgi:hypothetical protein